MSDRFDSWVTVIPPKDKIGETARALLDLAPDPRDVRTLSNGDEFLVPPELAAAFEAINAPAKPKAPRRVKKEEGS